MRGYRYGQAVWRVRAVRRVERRERQCATVGVLAVAVFDGEVALGLNEQLNAVHVLELRRHMQRGEPYAGLQV